MKFEPLVKEEQEQLIQRFQENSSNELDGGMRQLILTHPLAGSPLFLEVLLKELRQCGRHDTFKVQLAFYLSSKSVAELYERVLEQLENDGNGDVVRKVMTAIWASRAGLTETELLAITELTPLQWAPIDLALKKAFGRNGNRLVFDHDYLRIAVEDRYLPTEEQKLNAHSELADWYEARDGWDERDSEELPWQLQEAARFKDLHEWLLQPWALAKLQWDRGSREFINYWLVAKEDGCGELDELIADAVEKEIEERKDDAGYLIWLIDRIAGLLDEAGLNRELLLRLRTTSLELEEATEGRDEEWILSSLDWLASAHSDMGNYNEAEALFLRCLEAREKLLGPKHPSTLTSINNLANLYNAKGEYEKAETFHNRCLEAQERLLGPEHPSTLTSINNLASLGEERRKKGLISLKAITKKILLNMKIFVNPFKKSNELATLEHKVTCCVDECRRIIYSVKDLADNLLILKEKLRTAEDTIAEILDKIEKLECGSNFKSNDGVKMFRVNSNESYATVARIPDLDLDQSELSQIIIQHPNWLKPFSVQAELEKNDSNEEKLRIKKSSSGYLKVVRLSNGTEWAFFEEMSFERYSRLILLRKIFEIQNNNKKWSSAWVKEPVKLISLQKGARWEIIMNGKLFTEN